MTWTFASRFHKAPWVYRRFIYWVACQIARTYRSYLDHYFVWLRNRREITIRRTSAIKMNWTTGAWKLVAEQPYLWLLNFADVSSPCFFTCPPYTYHQDDDVIVFVIKVPNIALDTVSLGFNKNKVSYIDWTSVGSACCPRSSCHKAKLYCSPWAHEFNLQISVIWQRHRLSYLKLLTQSFKESFRIYLGCHNSLYIFANPRF